MCKFYKANKTNGDRAKRLEKKMRDFLQREMAMHVSDAQWKMIKQLLRKTLRVRRGTAVDAAKKLANRRKHQLYQ